MCGCETTNLTNPHDSLPASPATFLRLFFFLLFAKYLRISSSMIFFPLTSYWFYLVSCACRIVMHTFFQLFLSNATKSTSFAIRKQDFSIRYHNVKFLFDRHKNVIMRSEFTFFAVFVQFQLTFNLLQSTQLVEISRLFTGENRRRFAIIQSEKSPVDQCFHFMHELIQREFDYFSDDRFVCNRVRLFVVASFFPTQSHAN